MWLNCARRTCQRVRRTCSEPPAVLAAERLGKSLDLDIARDLQEAPSILEVTLRDGSYLIDFQFTADDTQLIGRALDAAGFRWIEIGHGLGLHASDCGKGVAAASDEEYLAAAAESLEDAHWGVFFIPGIGRTEDLEAAASYGMSFVRVGTNITQIEQARPYIERAKELGLAVSYNAMKSYAVSPEEFGHNAALAASWGADIVCLVDSAGGMFPKDIAAYLDRAKQETGVVLGFHGHDNLSLAVANSLAAIDHGARLVDSSLCGMGRSTGNATTEVLVAILKQLGFAREIDLNFVMDVGQGLVAPIMATHGLDPLGVTVGYARFHSSFLPKVAGYAEKHGVDVRDLIVRLCEQDVVNAPDELLESLGAELAREAPQRPARPMRLKALSLAGKRDVRSLPRVLKDLRSRASKACKPSALNVVIGHQPMAGPLLSGNIQPTPTHLLTGITLTKEADLREVMESADGLVDCVFLDADQKPFGPSNQVRTARERLKRSQLLTYLDSRVWIQAVEDQAVRLLGETPYGLSIVIAGRHNRTQILATRFAERLAAVTLLSDPAGSLQGPADTLEWAFTEGAAPNHAPELLEAESPEARAALANAAMVVVWPAAESWFDKGMMEAVAPQAIVLDARIGGMTADGIAYGAAHAMRLLRVDIWPALAGALAAAHDSQLRLEQAQGRREIEGVQVVAGGVIGRLGDIVLDHINQPTRVIGVADGRGGLLDAGALRAEDEGNLKRVRDCVNSLLVVPKRTRQEAR